MASAFARFSQWFRKISEELHLERRNSNSTQGINMNPSMATPLSSALHLCQRIREDYSHISVGHFWLLAINKQQCMLLSNKVDCDRNLSERDNDSLLRAAKQDREDLKVKKNYHEELYNVNGIKLTEWPFVVLANLQDLDKGVLLGAGSCGRVHEAKWLGESYAMKIPKPAYTEALKREIAAVAVLTGEPTPFPTDELQNPSVKTFKDRVREGKRPQLPHYSPSLLSNLIQQCWDANPDKRPNFQEICKKLRHIKGLLLTEGSSPEAGNLSASRVSTSIQEEDSDQERFKLGRLEQK
ncbi:unnamed protein product [Sphagnum tenellum]